MNFVIGTTLGLVLGVGFVTIIYWSAKGVMKIIEFVEICKQTKAELDSHLGNHHHY
jgi:hypothetical protein